MTDSERIAAQRITVLEARLASALTRIDTLEAVVAQLPASIARAATTATTPPRPQAIVHRQP